MFTLKFTDLQVIFFNSIYDFQVQTIKGEKNLTSKKAENLSYTFRQLNKPFLVNGVVFNMFAAWLSLEIVFKLLFRGKCS